VVRRSSVLHNVSHDQLMGELGNLLVDGWRVMSAHATTDAQWAVPTSNGGLYISRQVLYWTVFLEKEFPDAPHL
jgi:hypothetical protein